MPTIIYKASEMFCIAVVRANRHQLLPHFGATLISLGLLFTSWDASHAMYVHIPTYVQYILTIPLSGLTGTFLINASLALLLYKVVDES